ncbi:hypothetical protein F5I97DRAFT_1923867 [Phlebopus sp. FC_14]|nr:hypothetical protein F5I97DRAFT_1923867 [Phlebopus sp. FC_14]
MDAGASAQCSQPRLGFTFDSAVTNALHINSIADVVSGIATAAQVLHPIACVLTFFAFLNTLADILPLISQNKRGTCQPSFRLAIVSVSTLSTWLVFIIDISVLSTVRDTLNKSADNVVTLSIGNGVWIVLVAAIGSLFTVLWYLVQRCRVKARKKVGT